MKQTLLQMTQDILSSMSSDEVNSIGDTTESLQVANIIRQKFFDIIARIPLENQVAITQLDPSLDVTKPVVMYVPDNVEHIDWLKYFNSQTTATSSSTFQHGLNVDITPSSTTSPPPAGYTDVNIISNFDFINMVSDFNPKASNIATMTFNGIIPGQNFTFYYHTDRTPQFCTILNNKYVIFDAYDKTVDSTLQGSKTMVHAKLSPTFRMEDGFIPPINDEQSRLLFNEAKDLAFFELKQQGHQLADREVKRGWTSAQKYKSVAQRPTFFDALPDYGRQGRGGWGVPSYFKLRGFDR